MKYHKWLKSIGVAIILSTAATAAWADGVKDTKDCFRLNQVGQYSEALPLCYKAANQGDVNAQFILGMMYLNGYGIKKDYTEAAKWYRKVANKGNPDAQSIMGVLYENGFGVIKSGAAAADWYYKAGLSFLKEGSRDEALHSVENIKLLFTRAHLTVPNAFLADRLLNKIYGGQEK